MFQLIFLSNKISTRNTNWHDLQNEGQCHFKPNDTFKLLIELLVIQYEYVSKRVGLSAI